MLCRPVLRLLLPPLLLALAASAGVLGQEPFDEAITVTASRLPVGIDDSGRTVERLDGEEIERHAVHAIPETLQLLPGVDVRRRGVLGAQADLSIRGSSYEEVLVLIDGIPMNDPQTGHHNLDLPLPLAAVERVEALYGPGSSLYGANAAAGVVQLFTREPASSGARLALFAGQHSLAGGSGALDWRSRSGGHWHTLSAERVETDGHRPGTELDSTLGWYRGGLATGAGSFRLTAGASERDFGAQNFYSIRFPNQVESTDARLGAVSWERIVADFEVETRGSWRQHDDVFVLDRFDPTLLTNVHRSRVGDLQATASRRWSELGFEAGVGATRDDLDSSNLGERRRDRQVGFASLLGDRRRWSWRGSLHLDRLDGDGVDDSWQVHPSASLVVDAGPGRLHASLGSAYRLPSFTELYYRDPASAGNPDLEPEQSWSGEIGWSWSRPDQRAGLTLFERRAEELIDFVLAPGDDLFRARNLRRVDTRGLEAVAALRFRAGAERRLTLTGSYAWLESDGDEPEGISAYVFDYLEHRAVVRLEGDLPARLLLGTALSWNVRNASAADGTDDDWWRLDARLGWRWPGAPLELYLEASNLTDERYVERQNVEMPGRWAVVGLRARL